MRIARTALVVTLAAAATVMAYRTGAADSIEARGTLEVTAGSSTVKVE